MFAAAGDFERIPESAMDITGGVSGCTPAYVYLFIEALADGAVQTGDLFHLLLLIYHCYHMKMLHLKSLVHLIMLILVFLHVLLILLLVLLFQQYQNLYFLLNILTCHLMMM